ncbi:hypothetical protein MTQ01_03250 [Streptomyces sp. XM4193]|uniref:hypothetical protein n=1 Tax=Streptomyces sp. XM4193 TaxID=2929782 RepID=UPI001FF9FF6F|nr:hypothetical protein [Streptomyces sp. XM4193]MCK1795044.1 hypothetical protein [Streptomyces sp. XM4193]
MRPADVREDGLEVLARLAAEGATGALFGEAGAVYLQAGQVVHAESPAAPTIGELLVRAGRTAADAWQSALRQSERRGRVAHALLAEGRVARGQLEICHLGALYDAAWFALGGDLAPLRFRAGADHWLGAIRPVPAAVVDREVRRRCRLLNAPPQPQAAAPVRPSSAALAARAGGRPWRCAGLPAVPPRRQPVLTAADGARSATDIARLLGRPTFHVLLDVRRLANAGYLEPLRAQWPAPAAGDAAARRPVLPRRVKEPTAYAAGWARYALPGSDSGRQTGREPVRDAGRDAERLPDHRRTTDHGRTTGHLRVPDAAPRPGPAARGRTPDHAAAVGPDLAPDSAHGAEPDIALLRRVRDALEEKL